MTGFIAFFSFLLTFFTFFQAQADEWETFGTPRIPASTGYTCRIDSNCLDHLYNTLLNKQSPESIYSFCEEVHNRNKNCCLNPSDCNAPYAEGSNLKENSYSFFQQHGGNVTSCQLNNLSSLMSGLSQMQNGFCSNGKNHCREMCRNKLGELRRVFRDCFSVEDRYSINHVLEKAKNPTSNHDCYKEMNNVAEIYRRQSRNQRALFKDHLESQDIVDCAGIGREKATSNLNSLAVSICQQAQQKRQEIETTQRQEEVTPQEMTTKPEVKLGSENLSSGLGNNQSKNEVEGSGGLGSEALLGAAGATAGALALKKSLKKDNKGSSQGKGFENTNLKTISKKAHSQGDKNSSRTRNATRKNTTSRRTKKATSTAGSGHLSGSKTKPSTAKPLQLAESRISTGKCLVHVPEIKSTVMFQSVEAPQIEPMNEQEHPPYNNYDLVRGKRAGVLVELGRGFKENISFTLKLYVGKKLYRSKCHHTPLIGQMTNNEFTDCIFKKSDLDRDGYHKFFPFPLFKPVKNISVWIVLMPKSYQQNRKCWKGKHSGVSIIETPGLKLGFTGINGGRSCSGYNPAPLEKVRSFVNSKEVKDYLPSMFPVPWIKAELLTMHNNKDYISGNCNNKKANPTDTSSIRTIVGTLRDIDTLERMRGLKGYSKIIAVTSKDYFDFHLNFHDKFSLVGFVLLPFRRESLNSEVLKGGSWNVAFVRDDQEDKGTVAHELAHTLGQGKDFYDSKEECQTFSGDKPNSCTDYKIPRGLNAWIKFRFIKNKSSILSDISGIKKLWIDRDSYQKIFFALSEVGDVVPEGINLYRVNNSQNLKDRKLSLRALISGFYYSKDDSFLLPKTTVNKTRFAVPSVSSIGGQKISTVTFQLRDKFNKILQSVERPLLKTDIKIFYKNKPAKRVPFKFYHLLATLNLPKNSQKRGLKVVVISPKGRVIHTSPIKIKQGWENVAFIDRVR